MPTNQCVNVDCGASIIGNNKSERLHLSDPHEDSSERREQRRCGNSEPKYRRGVHNDEVRVSKQRKDFRKQA